MSFLPLLFVILPTIQLLLVNASTSGAKFGAHIELSLNPSNLEQRSTQRKGEPR
jgi:hypothetical protein